MGKWACKWVVHGSYFGACSDGGMVYGGGSVDGLRVGLHYFFVALAWESPHLFEIHVNLKSEPTEMDTQGRGIGFHKKIETHIIQVYPI